MKIKNVARKSTLIIFIKSFFMMGKKMIVKFITFVNKNIQMENSVSKRLKEWLNKRELSASKFAEILGVQKSSISHILSGRNKPSFDFLQKFKEHYPDLDIEWFITGTAASDTKNIDKDKDKEIEVFQSKEITKKGEEQDNKPPFIGNNKNDLIDYIMIVYKDDTFKIINKRN